MPQATNNTDYLLLASNDVSIFFDNSFVTKTSLTSVSPGESFQTFLGIDPAVKVNERQTESTLNPLHVFPGGMGCTISCPSYLPRRPLNGTVVMSLFGLVFTVSQPRVGRSISNRLAVYPFFRPALP